MTFEYRPGTIEESVRTPQRNPEEQVLVQHARPQALTARGGLGRIAVALAGVLGADQIVLAEEQQQFFQRLLVDGQAGFGIGRRQHMLRVAQAPVLQQAHGNGTEFEVAPAQRVGEGPLGRAIVARRRRGQLQVGPQRRQVHSPSPWRNAASGRRSR